MATTAVSYPKISRNMWAKLRARFTRSIPTTVTPAFVSSVVMMVDASAVSNVIKPLQILGLIDDQRKPTPLANQWRHDDEYANVCKAIRERIYPDDLRDTYPHGTADERQGIIKWFMKSAHVGDAAARMFADTYCLLAQADASSLEEQVQNTPSEKKRASSKPARKAAVSPPVEIPDGDVNSVPIPQSHAPQRPFGKFPAVHIDVQVHISPDTSSEQIDRIFESMAKHLGNFTD